MKYFRAVFLLILAIVLISISLANRDLVTLRLLPEGLINLSGRQWQVELPLFVTVFGGIVAGLIIGFVWEWFREHKHRREATFQGREARRLEREVTRMKGEQGKQQDEVLALLEDKS